MWKYRGRTGHKAEEARMRRAKSSGLGSHAWEAVGSREWRSVRWDLSLLVCVPRGHPSLQG